MAITEHLSVGYASSIDTDAYKVYSTFAYRPAIPHRIATLEDAVEIAKFLDKIYGDYWWIHENEEWKKSSIPQICQYSVKDGIRTFVALSKIKGKITITFQDVINAFNSVQINPNE